jgi:hypothetical protein
VRRIALPLPQLGDLRASGSGRIRGTLRAISRDDQLDLDAFARVTGKHGRHRTLVIGVRPNSYQCPAFSLSTGD